MALNLPAWCRETITRLRAPYKADRFGNPTSVRDWTAATSLDIPGCSVQPVAGTEVFDDRDARVQRWIVYAPVGTDLMSTDRIIHKGVTYEVDGDIRVWTGATGTLDNVQAILERVDG